MHYTLQFIDYIFAKLLKSLVQLWESSRKGAFSSKDFKIKYIFFIKYLLRTLLLARLSGYIYISRYIYLYIYDYSILFLIALTSVKAEDSWGQRSWSLSQASG